MTPLCIYHGHCDDGFAAAWAVRFAFNARGFGLDAVEFYAGQYQRDPPDVTGRDVILVDFSYKRPVLMEMAAKARCVVILDHHHTAAQDLFGFNEPPPFALWEQGISPPLPTDGPRIYAQFDMARSGAGMAWDFFNAGRPRLSFIDYIEDRDLWRKELPGCDEFTIALRSYPQDFNVWDALVLSEQGPDALIGQGVAIQRYYRLRVEELKRSAYAATLNGVPVWITNAPYFAASEVAGELAERSPMGVGVCYFEVAPGRYAYSLRSRGGFDVSTIAREYGGGGHKAAAGFTADKPVHYATPAA